VAYCLFFFLASRLLEGKEDAFFEFRQEEHLPLPLNISRLFRLAARSFSIMDMFLFHRRLE